MDLRPPPARPGAGAAGRPEPRPGGAGGAVAVGRAGGGASAVAAPLDEKPVPRSGACHGDAQGEAGSARSGIPASDGEGAPLAGAWGAAGAICEGERRSAAAADSQAAAGATGGVAAQLPPPEGIGSAGPACRAPAAPPAGAGRPPAGIGGGGGAGGRAERPIRGEGPGPRTATGTSPSKAATELKTVIPAPCESSCSRGSGLTTTAVRPRLAPTLRSRRRLRGVWNAWAPGGTTRATSSPDSAAPTLPARSETSSSWPT